MKLLTSFLFASILIIKSQCKLSSIQNYDSELSDLTSNLHGREVRIALMLQDFRPLLEAAATNFTKISKLYATLNDTINLVGNIATINNHALNANTSTCLNINLRITGIEMNIRRYVAIQVALSINATALQTQLNLCNHYAIINRVNVQDLTATGNGIVKEMLGYIKMLSSVIGTEASINGNLKIYKRSYCTCQTGPNVKMTSQLEANIAFIESPLQKLQTSVVTCAKDAAGKLATATDLVANAALKIYFAKLKPMLESAQLMSDFPRSNGIGKTTCSELQKRLTAVKEIQVAYAGILDAVAKKFALMNAYSLSVNATATAINATLSVSQRSAIINLKWSLGMVCANLLQLTDDLKYSVGRTAAIYGDMKGNGDAYCSCMSSNVTTTTTTAATTTTTEGVTTTTEEEELTTNAEEETVVEETTTEEGEITEGEGEITEGEGEITEATEVEGDETTPNAESKVTSPTTTTFTTTKPVVKTTSTTNKVTTTTNPTTKVTTTTKAPTTTSVIATTSGSSTSTTESSTRTTTKGLEPCGTFVDYNYLDAPNDPAERGFSAGPYYGGAQAYVGSGSDLECSGFENVAARIQIPPDNPGAYIPCNQMQVDADTPRFLLAHPSLYWISSESPELPKIDKSKLVTLIEKNSNIETFVGRMNVTVEKAGTFTTVGLVVNTADSGIKMWYMKGIGQSDATMIQATSGFEWLVC